MSKKSSSVILKNFFKSSKEFLDIYLFFKQSLSSFKNKTFLVAVSGGPDSLALSALAKAYSYEKKIKVYFVLIDHKLRKNSSREAEVVKNLLKKYNINLQILVNKKKIEKNIQSQAREVRYNLLSLFCKKKKANILLTGHNLEDQVETFLIRLSRGSGLDGLSSMRRVSRIDKNISLVRPLLDFKKKQLIEISKGVFGKYIDDPTNKNDKYFRTRIRKFKKNFEKIGLNYDQIFKSIENLASSRDVLNNYLKDIFEQLIIYKKGQILINFKDFNNLNQEIKMRVLKKSIQDLSGRYYSPRSKKIFNLIDGIKFKKKTKFTLGGCFILRVNNHIILEKEAKCS